MVLPSFERFEFVSMCVVVGAGMLIGRRPVLRLLKSISTGGPRKILTPPAAPPFEAAEVCLQAGRDSQ
jgi:hypothetical protein